MSRMHLPFVASDISELTRHLRAELRDIKRPPSHVELLNMLARAVGFRNFQHYRADAAARARLEAPPEPAPPVDHAAIARLARNFDDRGRLARWPSKQSQQQHTFGDHALLRRELCNYGLVERPIDGSAYERVEKKPPPEAAALIRVLRQRTRSTSAPETRIG